MHVQGLVCVGCGEVYTADEIRYSCKKCHSSVDVLYNYNEVKNKLSWDLLRERNFSHLRYKELLPVLDPDFIVRMGEGGTPLLKSTSLGEKLGIDLYFKMESLNPTGSFKDRGTSVELGKALEHGAEEIVTATTGNMGSSIAAYCARASVEARIYVPHGVASPKLKHMREHGAEVIEVSDDYNDAEERAWEDKEEDDMYLMGDYPYRGEGEKTVGHEIGDQAEVDKVVAPIGNGTLIHGVWKGFCELRTTGLLKKCPEMVGVQSKGCNSVVGALNKGREKPDVIDQPDTVADAISCGEPLDGDQAIMALRESEGTGITVSDKDILEAKQVLAKREGIYAEEAGAVALAGILKNRENFRQGEKVVCIVTGHGLKT